ncbi:hypothetical protein [Asanoa iriomotensis]|uniref:CBM6 domain-containing protein n=1 Tax=Asanoa iriomotensis TaxID=234613 RepID=A0ABQ4C8P6_9ACTN|nr:hypothetical protein [Asanoa iriomotensis]GIF59127.1 hypothetical protein Air01nite_52220 [Asanoa iriomotensis]
MRMSTAGDEPGELRIGGWLPPADPAAADDAPVTQVIPAVRDQPRRSEARRGAPVSDDEPPTEPRRRGRRTVLAVAASLTTVAVAAGVPLLMSTLGQPEPPDQVVLPVPTASGWPLPEPEPEPTGPTATPGRPTKPPASRGAVRPPAHATTPPATPRTSAAPLVAAAPQRTQVIEAEDADLDGWARTRQVDSASGGEVVTGIGRHRGELTFSGLDAPRAGDYDVVFSFVADDRRELSVRVNGRDAGRFDFPSSGGWETVQTMTVRLPLAAGPNTVELSNSDGWAPDIDRIALTTSD